MEERKQAPGCCSIYFLITHWTEHTKIKSLLSLWHSAALRLKHLCRMDVNKPGNKVLDSCGTLLYLPLYLAKWLQEGLTCLLSSMWTSWNLLFKHRVYWTHLWPDASVLCWCAFVRLVDTLLLCRDSLLWEVLMEALHCLSWPPSDCSLWCFSRWLKKLVVLHYCAKTVPDSLNMTTLLTSRLLMCLILVYICLLM